MERVEMWERQAIVDESHMCKGRATLDGRPAVVVGFREPFAHVVALDTNGAYSADYAWSTARRIMYGRNGHFGS